MNHTQHLAALIQIIESLSDERAKIQKTFGIDPLLVPQLHIKTPSQTIKPPKLTPLVVCSIYVLISMTNTSSVSMANSIDVSIATRRDAASIARRNSLDVSIATRRAAVSIATVGVLTTTMIIMTTIMATSTTTNTNSSLVVSLVVSFGSSGSSGTAVDTSISSVSVGDSLDVYCIRPSYLLRTSSQTPTTEIIFSLNVISPSSPYRNLIKLT